MAIQKDWVYDGILIPNAYHFVRTNHSFKDPVDGLDKVDFSTLIYIRKPTQEGDKPLTWVSDILIIDKSKNEIVQIEDHLLTLPAYAGGIKVA